MEADEFGYVLKCVLCGREYPAGGWRLACDAELSGQHGPSLLRASYSAQRLAHPFDTMHPAGQLARYAPCIPARARDVPATARCPVAFPLEKLGARLGLRRLWATFCGHWPERGVRLATCSFKELEASAVGARLAALETRTTLVVASAGNTARAFAQSFSRSGAQLVVVVPEAALPSLWSPDAFGANVRLVAVRGGDYSDAIRFADLVAKLPGFAPEGGARNVARRDGMGVAALAAVDALGGEVPAHYFQAIGSGTGVVAAWEATERVRRGVGQPMRLHAAQNAPFTPMHDAWQQRSRKLLPMDEADARQRIARVGAVVLTNRTPPYSIAGGVFDALEATNGATYSVTNEEAAEAAKMFEEVEGVDVDIAASVAVAALVKAAESKSLPVDDVVLINVTGGGQKRLFADVAAAGGTIHTLKPFAMIEIAEINEATARKLFVQ